MIASTIPMIVNLAPTGAVADANKNPHVPVTEDAILADVIACVRAGVSMVHLHVRDDEGKPSSDPVRFQSLISAIRATPEGRDIIVCATTSGRHGQTAQQRAAVLDLSGNAKPDMASLTLSSLNFAGGASINPPDAIRFLAKRMQERGIRPELEIFDLGMINFARVLIREGLITPPYYFNLLLGNIAGAQASLNDVGALVNALPAGSFWSLAGIGESQRTAAGLGCIAGSGVRIGLEDNLWQEKTTRTPATNLQLVEWLTGLARAYRRPIVKPAEIRQWLAFPVDRNEW